MFDSLSIGATDSPCIEYAYEEPTPGPQSPWTPDIVAILLAFATGCAAALAWCFTDGWRSALVWFVCWAVAFVLTAVKAARRIDD